MQIDFNQNELQAVITICNLAIKAVGLEAADMCSHIAKKCVLAIEAENKELAEKEAQATKDLAKTEDASNDE